MIPAMYAALLLAAIYCAFVSLGLPDGVFGVAWPGIRAEFAKPLETAGVVSLLLMSMSAFSSVASARLLRHIGTGRLTFLSCLTTGLCLWGYGQAPSFLWLLALSIPLGFGQGAVDVGLNHYVANHYSSRHMSWLHCCWGVGASLGPYILTQTVAAGMTWREGYGNLAMIQLGVAAILLLSLPLWTADRHEYDAEAVAQRPSMLKSLPAWFGVLLFFTYAGLEFSAGLWAASFLIESRDIARETAGIWVAYFFASLMLGRFTTGLVVNRLGNRALVRIGIGCAVIGAALLFLPGVETAPMFALMLLGFGLGPLYPCMMHETPKRFDKETARTLISLQVGVTYVGGSIVTAALGVVLARVSLEAFPVALALMLGAMLAMSEWQNART